MPTKAIAWGIGALVALGVLGGGGTWLVGGGWDQLTSAVAKATTPDPPPGLGNELIVANLEEVGLTSKPPEMPQPVWDAQHDQFEREGDLLVGSFDVRMTKETGNAQQFTVVVPAKRVYWLSSWSPAGYDGETLAVPGTQFRGLGFGGSLFVNVNPAREPRAFAKGLESLWFLKGARVTELTYVPVPGAAATNIRGAKGFIEGETPFEMRYNPDSNGYSCFVTWGAGQPRPEKVDRLLASVPNVDLFQLWKKSSGGTAWAAQADQLNSEFRPGRIDKHDLSNPETYRVDIAELNAARDRQAAREMAASQGRQADAEIGLAPAWEWSESGPESLTNGYNSSNEGFFIRLKTRADDRIAGLYQEPWSIPKLSLADLPAWGLVEVRSDKTIVIDSTPPSREKRAWPFASPAKLESSGFMVPVARGPQSDTIHRDATVRCGVQWMTGQGPLMIRVPVDGEWPDRTPAPLVQLTAPKSQTPLASRPDRNHFGRVEAPRGDDPPLAIRDVGTVVEPGPHELVIEMRQGTLSATLDGQALPVLEVMRAEDAPPLPLHPQNDYVGVFTIDSRWEVRDLEVDLEP